MKSEAGDVHMSIVESLSFDMDLFRDISKARDKGAYNRVHISISVFDMFGCNPHTHLKICDIPSHKCDNHISIDSHTPGHKRPVLGNIERF